MPNIDITMIFNKLDVPRLKANLPKAWELLDGKTRLSFEEALRLSVAADSYYAPMASASLKIRGLNMGVFENALQHAYNDPSLKITSGDRVILYPFEGKMGFLCIFTGTGLIFDEVTKEEILSAAD